MKLKFYIPLFLGLLFSYSASAQNDVAIKTNVLYDLTATINAGVEIGLAPRWTLDVSGNFNAWDMSEGKKWKHYLSFRVTETAVIFNNLGAVRSKHKTEVETALECSVFSIHSFNCGKEDFLHTLFCNFRCVIGVGSNCTHTACVETFVIVLCSLVVH